MARMARINWAIVCSGATRIAGRFHRLVCLSYLWAPCDPWLGIRGWVFLVALPLRQIQRQRGAVVEPAAPHAAARPRVGMAGLVADAA